MFVGCRGWVGTVEIVGCEGSERREGRVGGEGRGRERRAVSGSGVQEGLHRSGVSGCRGVGVSGCRGVGLSGCRGVGVSGCRGVGVSGCRGRGLKGFLPLNTKVLASTRFFQGVHPRRAGAAVTMGTEDRGWVYKRDVRGALLCSTVRKDTLDSTVGNNCPVDERLI